MRDAVNETAVERVEAELPDMQAGVAALSEMDEREFGLRLQSMRRGRERLARIHRELMDPAQDYGLIPGTPKPTLLKPGAERLASFYRLAASFSPILTFGDGQSAPEITVVTECRLHLGTLDGPVVNTGHGACNSWERRYRNQAQRNGAYDLLNTLLKMSEKRAYVDAVLRATAASGLFAQDLEDMGHGQTQAPRQAGNGHKARSQSAVRQPAAAGVSSGGYAGPAGGSAASAPGGQSVAAVAEHEPDGAELCSWAGCAVVLDADERKNWHKYFDEPYCFQHGRELIAQRKADAELEAELDDLIDEDASSSPELDNASTP